MSRIYDNWERLVKATLLREKLRQISRQDSLSSSSSSFSSSFHFSNLGISLSHHQIIQSTNCFSNQNLIKRGFSGDLFRGLILQTFPSPIVIKRINFSYVSREAFSLELDFLSMINSHKRFVLVLGYCLEEEEKFLVYKYATNGDLLNSLFKKPKNSDDLLSLDWITRLKIATGAAEGLYYLHHECDPPIAHGDIQASSITLDDHFEVRLGSLSRVCTQERESTSSRKSEKETKGRKDKTSNCSYDVYCFGKVLLELITGNLGISSTTDAAAMKKWSKSILPYISLYEKELVEKIIDPSLIIDEDLLEEVWGMAILAKACLNPKPNLRPIMRDVLKALENPSALVRIG